MSNCSHSPCNCGFESIVINITGIILCDFYHVNSSFLLEQFISLSNSRRKTSSFNLKKTSFLLNMEKQKQKIGQMCGALNTKSQCDSRHRSVVLSILMFLGIKLLLTGLQRVHTT